MKAKAKMPVLYDAHDKPIPLNRLRSRSRGQVRSFLSGFKGANDENLADWVMLPLDINTILRNDLQKLRARSRDLARNDDTAKRFLSLLKQNVLGHAGIMLQAKNKLIGGEKADVVWNDEIEREWGLFSRKRRYRGVFESPSACGTMSLRAIAWLSLLSRAVDGECFIQILRGYPHNRHRFAVRFLNPDLLDAGFSIDAENGNRIDMGIEFDEFDRPVAYHFNEQHPYKKPARKNQARRRIPADQIIHIFRHEYVGQVRGIPDFAAIMHKGKMLNGVHEAVVVGWRVAASKMGFFTSTDPEYAYDPMDDEDGDAGQPMPDDEMEATPGSFETLPAGFDFKTFDPEYPTSTYEAGHRVFMQQLSNGLNVSSPTLSNDYSRVNYSSLRQALLEDREGWRCVQAEMIDDFYNPLFDDWYDWTANITRLINVSEDNRHKEPKVVYQPRGWPWVDPLKEVKAQISAVESNLRTRQSIIAETSGADFMDTVDGLEDEKNELERRGLKVYSGNSRAETNNTGGNNNG
jgi:lambda family phage portal protein